MPAIVDPEGPDGEPISVFESAAILMYLGRKFGRFYPADERKRVAVDEWLAWQIANVGPVFGHNNHFRNYAPEKVPYAIKRFGDEAHRLYGVLNKRLEGTRIRRRRLFDRRHGADRLGQGLRAPSIDIAEFPNVKRWIDTHAGAARGRARHRDQARRRRSISQPTRKRRRSCSASAPADR